MSSTWVFNSTSDSDNIQSIYCGRILESYPPKYVFSIKMKSGSVINFNDYKKYINTFSESDMVAISAAEINLNELYKKNKNPWLQYD